jgi:hypothetical protein
MQKSRYVLILVLVTIFSISYISIGYIQNDSHVSDSDLKPVTTVMNSGWVLIHVENKAVTPIIIRSDIVVGKPATASLSGTIDENNYVILEGVITLDGQNETVKLSGKATRGRVSWSVYEGEAYAAKMGLEDENGRFFLQGSFLEDGRGRFFGNVLVEGKECTILLEGNSTGIYENVNPVNTAKIGQLEDDSK